MRKTGVRASCNGISSSTKFSLNSCCHSGISESSHRLSRSIVVSFLLLAWISSGFPDPSSTNLDTGTGEMSLIGASSLSRTGISPTVLLLATPMEVYEMTWKCLDFLRSWVSPNVEVLSSTKVSRNSCSHTIDLFVHLGVLHFYFRFRFLLVYAEALQSYFHFFLVLDFWCICCSNTESCDEDDGEVGEGVVEEERADKPRTTNET